MNHSGHQTDSQHHQQNPHSIFHFDFPSFPPHNTNRHSSSPSSSSLMSSEAHRERSIGQQSDSYSSTSDGSPRFDEPPQRNAPQLGVKAPSLDLVGQPIHFISGQFAGLTIKMVLQEIQKADLGRKYARVDRRPLDPPPVVLLRLYNVLNPGTPQEVEIEMDYDDVQVLGLLCTVDLFPVTPPDIQPPTGPSVSSSKPSLGCYPPKKRTTRRRTTPLAPQMDASFPLAGPSQFAHAQHHGHHLPQGGLANQLQSPDSSHLGSPPDSTGTFSSSPSHYSGLILPSDASSDVVYYSNGFPITESSKQTQALAGETFVSPHLIDWPTGTKAIVFCFADLAVKIEGNFVLRYRVFDIFSRPFNQGNDLCVAAETYGGMFHVYSTKEFPGLSKSTELTKHLARWGVRLNIRETERKRRRPSGGNSAGDTQSDS